MSPPAPESASAGTGFPRVSGDEPQEDRNIGGVNLFSPRERG